MNYKECKICQLVTHIMYNKTQKDAIKTNRVKKCTSMSQNCHKTPMKKDESLARHRLGFYNCSQSYRSVQLTGASCFVPLVREGNKM